MMMKLAVSTNALSTHLLLLWRSFIRKNRGENLFAMLPVVASGRARPTRSSMLLRVGSERQPQEGDWRARGACTLPMSAR